MLTSDSFPNPVFTPYTVSPAARISSISARLAATRSNAAGAISTRQAIQRNRLNLGQRQRLTVQESEFSWTQS